MEAARLQAQAEQVWFAGETISMGIARGDHGHPLQQAHFAAEIGERGQIVATPRLVSAIRTAGSNTIVPAARDWRSDRHRHVRQWDVVSDGMVGVVSGPGGTLRISVGRSTSSPVRPAPLRCSPSTN